MGSISNNLQLNIPDGKDGVDWEKYLKENFEKLDLLTPALIGAYAKTETYSKTEMDTKLGKLDDNPYFQIDQTVPIGYDTAFTNKKITFESGNSPASSGVSIAAGQITINTDGVYFVHAMSELSGLNKDIRGDFLIRVTPPAGQGSAYETIKTTMGMQTTLNNTGAVWLDHFGIFKLTIGSKIEFFVQLGEAPRTILQFKASGYKISKHSVGV